MWNVYRVSFQDGFQYVGITKHSDIAERIRRHIVRPVNSELSRRLKSQPCDIEIVHRNVEPERVYALERQEIAALEKPINIYGTNGRTPDFKQPVSKETIHSRNRNRRYRKRNVVPPRKGKFRCSRCRTIKQWTEFHRDRSRFNGLNSRCKDCTREVDRERRRYAQTQPGDYDCRTCRKVLPHTAFRTSVYTKTGVVRTCMACEQYAAKWANNYPVQEGIYKCNRCGIEKPHTEYHLARTLRRGIIGLCKTCKNEEHRQKRLAKIAARSGVTE